eukprot:CAMPEP_0172619406 /NCGR_PEP_ID=MMETSP1068-20121228/93177_1 /TAXON_ID=35684 /ORGANISM="Pseudopedinella elastica, Strain CCMP716" /LENGTH=221 /DNA_ID=CAMNT_0013426151 /DNA_START=353 /DNA_END=1018 /DNA_ORIENTATION=-
MNEVLKPAAFPFLAVLMTKPGGGEVCVDRIEGLIDARSMTRRLLVLRESHRAQMAEVQSRQAERLESVNLRSEQDEEFERVLAADRQREQERLERQQEADDAKSQAELEAALEMSLKLDKEASLKRKRDGLAAEPAPGPETTKLRLQLPNGSKLDRRFNASVTLQEVRNFIDVYLGDNELSIESYSLSTNFPRRVYNEDAISLREAGLHPQSVLYVQDLDA